MVRTTEGGTRKRCPRGVKLGLDGGRGGSPGIIFPDEVVTAEKI